MANFWDNDPVAAPSPSNGKAAAKAAGPPKLSQADEQRLKNLDTSADETASLAQQAGRFVQDNTQAGTGLGLGDFYVGTANHHIPLNPVRAYETSHNPAVSDMDSLGAQMATHMRTPGMRLTQMEFGKFLGSVPSIAKEGDSNVQQANQIMQARVAAAAKQSFYHSFAQTHGTLNGADPAWAQYEATRLPKFLPANPLAAGLHATSAARQAQPAQAQDGATVDVFGRPVQ